MNRSLAVRLRLLFVPLALLGLLSLSACSGGPNQSGVPLPAFLKDAPARVADSYHYTMDNPQELEKYPCYCGCDALGHRSNRDCYIESINQDGSIIWDKHASGCQICGDITQDVKRMRNEGWNSSGIRTYIDNKYSPLGPPTDTPLPVD